MNALCACVCMCGLLITLLLARGRGEVVLKIGEVWNADARCSRLREIWVRCALPCATRQSLGQPLFALLVEK